MKTFKRWHGRVDFDDDLVVQVSEAIRLACLGIMYLVGHLNQFWTCPNRRTRDNAALFRYGGCFHDDKVKLVLWLIQRVKAIHKVNWEHAQMFVEKLNAALVDTYKAISSTL